MAVLASIIFDAPAPTNQAFIAWDGKDGPVEGLYSTAGLLDYYDEKPSPEAAEASIDVLLNIAVGLLVHCQDSKSDNADQALANAVETWLVERKRF